MSETDTKLHYLKARTNQLTDQMAQLTLNNQKEHGHPQRRTLVWVHQQRRMGLAPMAGAEVQVPPAEGNNPSAPYHVPFRRVPTTWEDIKALSAQVEEILAETKVEDTPENRFIAYPVVLSTNSAKTLLLIAIMLCLVGQGLATEVNSSYIY